MATPKGKSIEAFGQTWYFTPAAMSALMESGLGSDATLKAMVINLTSAHGLEEGEQKLEYSGVELLVSVVGNAIVVCDPFQPGDHERHISR
jgi:hypothetical protein